MKNQIEDNIYAIVRKITDKYFKFNRNKPKRDRKTVKNLTKDIKYEIGSFYTDYTVYPSEKKKNQWHYDLSIMKRNEKNMMESLILCLESELSARSNYDLRTDFNKLLASNALHRVFICFAEPRNNPPHSVNNKIDHLTKAFETYQNLKPGDRLLLLVIDDYGSGEVHNKVLIK